VDHEQLRTLAPERNCRWAIIVAKGRFTVNDVLNRVVRQVD